MGSNNSVQSCSNKNGEKTKVGSPNDVTINSITNKYALMTIGVDNCLFNDAYSITIESILQN